jgi:hypothetical protein
MIIKALPATLGGFQQLAAMDSAQNTKGASLEAAPLVPFGNFSLYIYFINLDGVNRKFF